MDGVARVNLIGKLPIVECRITGEYFTYFVCWPELGHELVMAFEEKLTAREIAINVYHGTPFFTLIPVVKYRTPYPRPWLVYPDTSETWRRIEFQVVKAS